MVKHLLAQIWYKEGIKRVFYSINDFDERSKNKSKNIIEKKILTNSFYLKERGLKFYESYSRSKK